jgi:hypothetical protein
LSAEGEIGIPLLGKLKLSSRGGNSEGDNMEPPPPSLEEVISVIDNEGRASTWEEAASITEGEWFYFETGIQWAIHNRWRTVIFMSKATSMSSGELLLLVLHGSPEHLLHPPENPRKGLGKLFSDLRFGWFISGILSSKDGWRRLSGSYHPLKPMSDPEFLIWPVVRASAKDRNRLPWQAGGYVSGYARSTAECIVFHTAGRSVRVLVGTPLYVEYERG